MMFYREELFFQVKYNNNKTIKISCKTNWKLLCKQQIIFFAELDTKTQNLSMLSQKYKKDAAYLNSKALYIKMVAGTVAALVFVLYFFIL